MFIEEIGSPVPPASNDLSMLIFCTKSERSISSLGDTSTRCILFKSKDMLELTSDIPVTPDNAEFI